MTWCPVCEKPFYDVSNLRGHAKKFHPDKVDEIAPMKQKYIKAVCTCCGKSFSKQSNLTRHVRAFHSDKIADLTNSHKAANYECEICGKCFMHLKKFNHHKKNHLHAESAEWTSEGTVKEKQKLKCCLCTSENNFEKSEIGHHLEVDHDIKLSSQNYKFYDIDEFYSWKSQVEKDTTNNFINKHGSYTTKSYLKKVFVCHRSGMYKPEGSGLRSLKAQGSNKINGYCPAEIVLKVLNNGECVVEFVSVHIGHNQSLGHLTLSKTERESIAAKIAANIPFETILDEIRDECISADKLERMHLLTKKDLNNIKQCFNLNNEEIRHIKDDVSVDVWVQEVEDIGYIP